MKRAEKNAISRQRILEAAREEFARHGYDGASLNMACAEKGISKGIVYHYFASKDELYLACAADCFDGLTAALAQAAVTLHGTPAQQLGQYFDARLRYFADHPDALGIFADAALHPPVRPSAWPNSWPSAAGPSTGSTPRCSPACWKARSCGRG